MNLNFGIGLYDLPILGGGIRPSVDLDFAGTRTLDPRITFTRASTGTFIGSNGLVQSAGNNVARFTHDPVTGQSLGLLIEESRTNLLLNSEAIGATGWSVLQSTVSSNTSIAPDGASTADTLVEAATTDYHQTFQNVSLTSGQVYAGTIYLKAGTSSWAFVALSGTAFGSTSRGASINLSTGAVGTILNSPTSVSVFPAGNGWYRVQVIATASATNSGGLQVIMATGDAAVITNLSYAGNVSRNILIWGAQLEAGAFATSYIPTTGASATRAADVATITGTNFSSWFNQSQGTFVVRCATAASGDRTILGIDDNTANEMIRLRTEGTDPFFRVTDGGVEQAGIDAGTVSANTLFNFAASYLANDFAACVNGGTVGTDNSGTLPTVDRMRVGQGQAGNIMCGPIARIRYWPRRLPNSRLQTLTA